MQVYLKQYFELFSIFDDIDTGCATLTLIFSSMKVLSHILVAPD